MDSFLEFDSTPVFLEWNLDSGCCFPSPPWSTAPGAVDPLKHRRLLPSDSSDSDSAAATVDLTGDLTRLRALLPPRRLPAGSPPRHPRAGGAPR
jgi:hypothetical protein